MDGSFWIGKRRITATDRFVATDPATGEPLPGDFAIASADDVAEACTPEDAAFDRFRETRPDDRARFLKTILADRGAR